MMLIGSVDLFMVKMLHSVEAVSRYVVYLKYL